MTSSEQLAYAMSLSEQEQIIAQEKCFAKEKKSKEKEEKKEEVKGTKKEEVKEVKKEEVKDIKKEDVNTIRAYYFRIKKLNKKIIKIKN